MHRLISDGDLVILGLMGNAGLAERGEARQLLLDAGEAAPGAREELIPGAEAGALALDVDCEAHFGGG